MYNDVHKVNGRQTYIETTEAPRQMTPFQDSPQGSPPFDFQLLSCEGLFNEAYKTCRACTADYKSQAMTQPEQNITPTRKTRFNIYVVKSQSLASHWLLN